MVIYFLRNEDSLFFTHNTETEGVATAFMCRFRLVYCKTVKGAVQKVMSVALIELVEMTATLNVVVSINSTIVMQTYWTASSFYLLSAVPLIVF